MLQRNIGQVSGTTREKDKWCQKWLKIWNSFESRFKYDNDDELSH